MGAVLELFGWVSKAVSLAAVGAMSIIHINCLGKLKLLLLLKYNLCFIPNLMKSAEGLRAFLKKRTQP